MNKSTNFIAGIIVVFLIAVINSSFAETILKKTWPNTPLRGIAAGVYDGASGQGYDANGYITEECFVKMKDWKVNVVRFMVGVDKNSSWDVSESDGDTLPALGTNKLEPYQVNLAGLAKAVEYAEKYKIHYIIYIGHTYARKFPTNNYTDFTDNLALLLEHLATTYGNKKYLLGYLLLDEPHYDQEVAETLDHSLSKMLIDKIRAIDKESYITLMPGVWGMNTQYASWTPLPTTHDYKVRYVAHMFAPTTFTHQGINGFPTPTYYPGDNWSWAKFILPYRDFNNNAVSFPWDEPDLVDYLQAARDFQTNNSLDPLLVGSFTVIRWADSTSAVQWIKDVTSILDGYGWGHIWHTFGEWNGWNPTFDNNPGAYPAAFDGGYQSAIFTELKQQWNKNTQYEVYETLADWMMDSNPDDASLSGNDLTAYGCTYDTSDFKTGTASINFNGTSDYLQSDAVSIDNQFTISAWVKIAEKSHATAIIGSAPVSASGDGFILFCNSWNSNDKKIYFSTSNGSTSKSARTDDNAIKFDKWHYITCVVDRKSGTATIYVDGVDKTAANQNAILTDFSVTKSIYVGQAPGQGLYFQGNMDSVKIVERLYSAEEIASIGYWKFDDNANDSSVLQNDLTLYGATYDSNAKGGKSLNFNGSSDYLQSEAVIDVSDKFTISAWVKIEDKNHSTTIIASAPAATSGDGFILFCNGWNSSNRRIYLTTSNGSTSKSARTDDNAINFNQWHYITCVVDRKQGNATIYIDGVDKTAANQNAILSDFSLSKLIYVGQSPTQGLYFQGNMDEVKITDRLLSQAEITAESEKYDTLASWEFETNTNDSSLSGRNLTAYSSTYDLADFKYGIASIVFDGSNSYLQSSETVSLPDQFTILGWMKISDQAHTTSIIGNANAGASGNGFLLCVNNWNTSNKKLLFITSNGTTADSAATDINAINFDQWHHIACVVDRVNGTARIFVDGIDKTTGDTILTDFNISKSLYLGCSDNKDLLYKGKMDNVKIVEGLLTQAEIQADM
ncbi:MAG: LamG domain-containing protein [Victivallaceae bacterium]|nr:LamG domain-containing protein [Victivallaceae bacterium]